jgi:hypothetical protein
MEIVALASPFVAVALLAFALRRDLVRATAPVLFALMVASMLLAYVGAHLRDTLSCFMAALGAAIAGVGLVAVVFEADAQLEAEEKGEAAVPTRPWLWSGRARRWREFEGEFWAHIAFLTWTTERRRSARRARVGRSRVEASAEPRNDRPVPPPVSEALFSFKRKGRAALLVFVRRDHLGHILEAAAYDPEDYP